MEGRLYSPCQDGRVLSDNVFPWGDGDFFRNYIYPLKSYRRVGQDLEQTLSTTVDGLRQLWGRPDVFTVGPVLEEFSFMCELFRDKLKFLNRHALRGRKRWEHDPHKRHEHYQGRRTLEGYCHDFFDIKRAVKNSVTNPKDPVRYREIFDFTYKVSHATGTMHDYSHRHKNPRVRPFMEACADESLVSMALYHSLVASIPVTVYSEDSDIHRTLHNTCHYLLPDSHVERQLYDSPIRVILRGVDEAEGQARVDTRNIEVLRHFKYAHSDAGELVAPRLLRVSDAFVSGPHTGHPVKYSESGISYRQSCL